MRCMTLADELQRNGCEIYFICHNLPQNLAPLIGQRDYSLLELPVSPGQEFDWERDAADTINCIDAASSDLDWLVVDHYQLDRSWESLLRTRVGKLMVIDDLANRPHDCDLLLDQNYYCDQGTRYDDLVGAECKKLLGPRYVLLRPEFLQARSRLRQRDGQVKRILVFFGGGDPDNLTATAVEAIQALLQPDIATDVVVGASNPHASSIEDYCNRVSNTSFHLQVSNMAELTEASDLALCAGGSTTWERCFLGLPSITVVVADNQESTTVDIAREGAIRYLGWADQLDKSDYVKALREMIAHPDELQAMSKNAMRLMGGEAYLGTPAVAAQMLCAADLDRANTFS